MTKEASEHPRLVTDVRRPRDAHPPPHPYEGTGSRKEWRLAVLILGYGAESPLARVAPANRRQQPTITHA